MPKVCGSLIGRDAELSEIFMRAFILRRLELIRRGQGNVVLLGSRHSARTLHLREFLTRNEHPFAYVDLDTTRLRKRSSTTFRSSWKKFRWSSAWGAPYSAIHPCRNWPIVWD